MPTYDISNVNEFTTTTFQEQSIVYLHGQHYGEWLLNAAGELDKVKDRIPLLLNKICHNRTWIIAGYSGEDEVFEEINNFSSFDNELYWIGYLNNRPSDKVEKELLSVVTKNAHLISGYDADTFFLDLHSKLNIETPEIFNKPFSFLRKMIREVEMPEEDKMVDEHKDLYKGLNERISISNEWVDRAVNEIQEEDSVEKFKQQIIEAYVKEEFEKNERTFLDKIKEEGYEDAKNELSDFFMDWGTKLLKSGRKDSDEKLIIEGIDKYNKAIEFNPNNDSVYYNLGNANSELAKIKSDETKYIESFKNYKKATDLDPLKDMAFNNWGVCLKELAKIKSDEKLYRESIEKYKKVSELNPEHELVYNNWANSLRYLAELKSDKKLYKESFEKHKKAIKLKPKDYDLVDNLIVTLLAFLHTFKNLANKEIEQILNEAEEKALEVYKNKGNPYNLSCVYAMQKDKEKALKYLEESLEKEITKEHVINDKDWKHYLDDVDFLALMNNYK